MRTITGRAILGALAAITTIAGAVNARAQSGSSALLVEPGAELRLILRAADAPTVRGRVVLLAGDTIVLRIGDATPRYTLRDLSALEVRGGKDRVRGMLIGAGINGVLGALFGRDSENSLASAASVNAVVGALIGYYFAPAGWERIPLPSPAAP